MQKYQLQNNPRKNLVANIAITVRSKSAYGNSAATVTAATLTTVTVATAPLTAATIAG